MGQVICQSYASFNQRVLGADKVTLCPIPCRYTPSIILLLLPAHAGRYPNFPQTIGML